MHEVWFIHCIQKSIFILKLLWIFDKSKCHLKLLIDIELHTEQYIFSAEKTTIANIRHCRKYEYIKNDSALPGYHCSTHPSDSGWLQVKHVLHRL